MIPQREYFDKDIANSDNTDGYYIIKQNDFVYNPRKSVSAPYGPISVYKYSNDGIVSPLYLCFRSIEAINVSFYEWYFKSPVWHRYVYLFGDSGVRHDRVSIKDAVFFEMPLHIPDNAEQEKIAGFLSLIEKKIQKQQQLVDSLKSYKRGFLHDIFTQKIKITNEENWTEISLGEIAKIYQPQTISTDQLDENFPYPVYGANGLIGYYSRFNHDTEQIAICCRGASCGTVNYIPAKSWITGNAMVINIQSKEVDKKFIYYQLLASDLSYMISGSGQPQIVRKPCEEHKILLPSFNTQIAISNLCNKIDLNINANSVILEKMIETKSAILQRLFI